MTIGPITTPDNILLDTKEFVEQALVNLDAPQNIIAQVKMATLVEIQSSRTGLNIGLLMPDGSRTTWSLA